MVKKTTSPKLSKLAQRYPDWKVDAKGNHTLNLTFKNHIDALAFIARLTVHTAVLEHYPEIVFTKAQVTIKLPVPKGKALGQKDLTLIERIERIVGRSLQRKVYKS